MSRGFSNWLVRHDLLLKIALIKISSPLGRIRLNLITLDFLYSLPKIFTQHPASCTDTMDEIGRFTQTEGIEIIDIISHVSGWVPPWIARITGLWVYKAYGLYCLHGNSSWPDDEDDNIRFPWQFLPGAWFVPWKEHHHDSSLHQSAKWMIESPTCRIDGHVSNFFDIFYNGDSSLKIQLKISWHWDVRQQLCL